MRQGKFRRDCSIKVQLDLLPEIIDESAKPLKEIIDRFGREYVREPGIVVRRAVPEDDPMSGIFEINVWAQIKMYASVKPSIPNKDIQASAYGGD